MTRGTIIFGKLVSGEIVIGKSTDEGMDEALVLNLSVASQGQASVSMSSLLFPYVRTYDGDFIPDNKFIVKKEAPKELENAYISIKSNIVIAQPSSIIT